MLQLIESSNIMPGSGHFLSIDAASQAIHPGALAVAWGACLAEEQPPAFPLASLLNQRGIPTIAADICFHSQVTTTSMFTLSLNESIQEEAVHSVNLPHVIADKNTLTDLTPSLLLAVLNQKKEAAHAYILAQVHQLAQGRTVVESSLTNAGILQLDETRLLAVTVKQIVLDDKEDKEQVIAKILKRGMATILASGAKPIGFAYHLCSPSSEFYEEHLQAQSIPILAKLSEVSAVGSLAVLVAGILEKQDMIASALNRAETTLMLVDVKNDNLPKHLILSANSVEDTLLMTLAQVCIKSQLGLNIKANADMLLSFNYVGHLVLEISNDKLKEIREIFTSQQIPYHQLGRTTNALMIQINNDLQLSLQSIKDNWQHILADMI